MRTYKELHFGYFLVDLLHKLNDEVDELVLQHLLRMEIGDQKGDVVSLCPVSFNIGGRHGSNIP